MTDLNRQLEALATSLRCAEINLGLAAEMVRGMRGLPVIPGEQLRPALTNRILLLSGQIELLVHFVNSLKEAT